jgi:3'-5' exonuclease
MIEKVTFIDIETVPYHSLDKRDPEPDTLDMMFLKKFKNEILNNVKSDQNASDFFYEKAALYAEFNQVVAVSIGKMHNNKFFVRSLTGRNEKILMEQVAESITLAGNSILCAHNGKEFDFPILMRKYMIHGIPIPSMLNIAGKKPWEVTLEDTMVMWSGTAWNYKVSLELLASIFGLPNPKANMTGASVADIYYGMFKVEDDQLPFDQEETALRKIGSYCSTDVITMANCWCKMKGIPTIDPSIIVHT